MGISGNLLELVRFPGIVGKTTSLINIRFSLLLFRVMSLFLNTYTFTNSGNHQKVWSTAGGPALDRSVGFRNGFLIY